MREARIDLQSRRDCGRQPKVARHELPWVMGDEDSNPTGLCPCGRNLVGVASGDPFSHGSSCLATVGFESESPGDSTVAALNGIHSQRSTQFPHPFPVALKNSHRKMRVD